MVESARDVQSSAPSNGADEMGSIRIDCARVVPNNNETNAPSGELGNTGPDELFDRARYAVSALKRRGRVGQPGNTLQLKTGLRSRQLLDAPDVVAWHAEQVSVIEADMGGTAELSALARASVREAARLEVIVAVLGDELLARGTLTGKGKCRAATMVYLQTLDRFTRLASTLGLSRRAKALPTIQDYMRGRE